MAEAQRLERLELDAIDALASLWAQAHPEVATQPVASATAGVTNTPNPKAVLDHPPKEVIVTEAVVGKRKTTLLHLPRSPLIHIFVFQPSTPCRRPSAGSRRTRRPKLPSFSCARPQ